MTNQALKNSLLNIENELKALKLWQITPREDIKLDSQVPFGVGILEPNEWLQWVFIPIMKVLLSNQNTIPTPFAITAYFNECYKNQPDKQQLIRYLEELDRLVNTIYGK